MSTVIETVDTFVNNASKSTSVLLSITGFRLTVLPNSTDNACGLSLAEKFSYRILRKKYKKYNNNLREYHKLLTFLTNFVVSVCTIMLKIKKNLHLCIISTKYISEHK